MKRLQSWLELDAHEIGRPHLRLKNPIYPIDAGGNVVGLEILAWELYDYLEVVVNTVLRRETMFSISQGQQYTPAGGLPFNKTALHTNMTGQGAVLPNPQKFIVKGLSKFYRPDILEADFEGSDYRTVFTFQVGDSRKEYALGVLAKVPSACGIFGVGAPAANRIIATQGWPVTSNLYSILADANDPGVEINQGQTFGVVYDPTLDPAGIYASATAQATGTGIKLWFNLVGSLTRSVQ